MIQLDGKTQTIHFPKNTDGWGPFTLTFHSELSQRNYTFENLSDEGSRGYLTFTINTSLIAPGEYNYSILDYDENEVGKGLAVCDIEESNPTVKYYEISATVKEYVPKYRPVEPMKLFLPEDFIAYTATTIPYKMVSALPWAMTVYLDGGQVGQTIFGESGTTEGEIEITQNLTNENRTYEFAYGDEDGEYAFSAYATQSGLPFSVSIFTPDEIPYSGTEISYTVEYSQRNTVRTAEVYLYKNGELIQQRSFGMYPYGFSSYFQIPTNTTRDEITYRVEVKTNKTPIYESVSASSECVQLIDEYQFKRFTIEMLEDGDIEWEGPNLYYDIIRDGERDAGYQLYHSIDGLLTGDVVEFYVNEDNPVSFNSKTLTVTRKHNVYGNIMSLLYVNYETATTLNVESQFRNLFYPGSGGWNRSLMDVSNLRLPATTLTPSCYREMFSGCKNITKAPALPATTLVENCYQSMFHFDESLEYAPVLPATGLAFYCYTSMFADCTGLRTAPALPATTLAEGCYYQMFYRCTDLETAPALPATTLANNCYMEMFENCTSLTTAPELPATTLVQGCYWYMFNNCTYLSYVKCLATDISALIATTSWLSGVSETGTFVKDASMDDWTTGADGIPSGWTVENE